MRYNLTGIDDAHIVPPGAGATAALARRSLGPLTPIAERVQAAAIT
jgi:hypothetical protein